MLRNSVIVVLVAALTLTISLSVFAQDREALRLEARVWQHYDNPGEIYVAVRYEGLPWSDPERVSLHLRSGTWWYSTVSWDTYLPLPEEKIACLPWHRGFATLLLSTVRVSTGDSAGTAFHIGDGYFITASHVIEGAESVTLWRGDYLRTRATVVKSVPLDDGDVSLLWADLPQEWHENERYTLRLGDGYVEGGELMIAGYPSGWENEVADWSTGDFRDYEATEIDGVTYWLNDAFTYFGYSGGAVIDSCGQLEGISLRVDLENSRSYFLPIGTAIELLKITP